MSGYLTILGLAPELKIDWTKMPTYNTIMAICAGVGLLLVVAFARRVLRGDPMEHVDGWALAFGALGLILTLTGLHMTLTWPLAGQGFPFDNIIFGEPCLAFGVILLFAALYLWKRGSALVGAVDRPAMVARTAGPISLLVLAMGLACFGIAAAGWTYTLFAAPPQEPISGAFADLPLLEATFISGLYVLVGVGAVLFPFALRAKGGALATIIGVCWGLAGLAFTLFGALNYFTHIGLIINTM
ncbi:DUF981 domain-containing protein [Nonomuraea sp. NBC_01738]|uniref:DUF981 family protein n=1 Tax=Nonomuraea sp. NBC_01738 TaxID=2976003 RepID=UPI002E1375C1|nr:DUF981 domain-containing protein [Nonomuraea sp. NBC_01738]